MLIVLAGIILALKAVFYSAVAQTAPGDLAGLVPEPAAAAVPAQLHGAKPAVEAAEREKRVVPHKALHWPNG
jgi:hypothetical protein